MYRIGAYLRLSKDDGDKETSDSIDNQKMLIENYVQKINDAVIIEFFIDDGFSGLSFDRPGFNKMIREIMKGNINTIITKDMSRLGRDRLETGHYIEKVFPLQKIRYISILDNYDSLTGSNADMAPIKGLFDEMYARDISKKVKGAFDAKRFNGDFIGAFAPYGYKKSPINKNKLIIDEEAANVVRRIFSMFVSGISKLLIAKILNNEGVPCPTVYKNNNGINYQNANRLINTRYWTYSTISRILENQMYTGDMVQKKEETIFKTKGKKISHDKSKWIVVKGTHESIIDQETFENVQRINAMRTRTLNFQQNITIYAGILKCADCSRSMSKTKFKNVVYYKCGSYKQLGKDYCSSHSIREDVLNEIVLNAIRNEAKVAIDKQDISKLINLLDISTINDNSKEIEKLENTLSSIGKYKKKAYEDFADELLSREDYIKYKNEYDHEEKRIKDKILYLKDKNFDLDEEIVKHQEYVKRFIKYLDIEELTREIMIEMIESIQIHKDKKIDIKFKFKSPLS